MTRDEILAMKPGRELDALVAEKVMGWHQDKRPGGGRWYKPEDIKKRMGYMGCPHYSTDIAVAFEVEEAMVKMGLDIMAKYALEVVVQSEGGLFGFFAIHASPEIRCKAALLATREGE